MTLTGLTEFLLARIAEDEAAASAVKDIGADVWDVQVIHRPLDLDPTLPVSWQSAMRCGSSWQSTAPMSPVATRCTRPTG
jgi:hypothetical protein